MAKAKTTEGKIEEKKDERIIKVVRVDDLTRERKVVVMKTNKSDEEILTHAHYLSILEDKVEKGAKVDETYID